MRKATTWIEILVATLSKPLNSQPANCELGICRVSTPAKSPGHQNVQFLFFTPDTETWITQAADRLRRPLVHAPLCKQSLALNQWRAVERYLCRQQ
jgi:hypothetical protein